MTDLNIIKDPPVERGPLAWDLGKDLGSSFLVIAAGNEPRRAQPLGKGLRRS